VSLRVEAPRDPWSPRPIDLPTPIDGDLDAAKIVAAPDDAREWPAWRDALARWREGAREGYDGSAYERPELAWTQRCFAVALLWLWDELLYDFDAGLFTPDRVLDEGEREFGGYDGVVLWHAYPVIGIDERNQFDFYRDVPGIRELVGSFHRRGVRVFVDYNPWDVGTRREPVDDAAAVAELVRWLDADGVFLDTMKEAPVELRAALDAARPGVAFEGESTLPLARVADHHLSWAQWFADSEVPGVIRTKWFEQRHMLHHTRRWNRDHSDELHSSWLNGTGMLVWENVFGAWVGWSGRDRSLLRTMLPVQRAHAELLARGEWTPLAARSDGLEVVGSQWRDGETELWTLVNRSEEPFSGRVHGPDLDVTIPPRGIAAIVEGEVVVSEDNSVAYPARPAVRVPAPVVRVERVPDGMVEGPRVPLTAVFRRRETGIYGEVPYVEEWKPLPPRLHDFVEVPRPGPTGRYAIGVREVTAAELGLPGDGPATGVDLVLARAYARARGARLPTEDEWQAAAEAGLLELAEPRVWNWTESEHRDGRTRFAILKGGSGFRAEGSDWYVDGGEQEPAYSLQLLLTGLAGSPWIGFRLAVDL
jgi:formylglycine-generating enzyme